MIKIVARSTGTVFTPPDKRGWPVQISADVRESFASATNLEQLFGAGARLLSEAAPPGDRGAPDRKRLIVLLQGECELGTNDGSVPWECMAWQDNDGEHFWGIREPIVRLYEGPTSLPASLRGSGTLLVLSDPDGDLGLVARHHELPLEERSELQKRQERIRRIKDLVLRSSNDFILCNPTIRELEQALTKARSLIIYIGHGAFDPRDPDASRFRLASSSDLTPNDLRQYLTGQPIILFIACVSARYQAQGSGVSALPAMGFMPACLDVGARAFIGPLWKPTVDEALEVTECICKHLVTCCTPAEALSRARRELFENSSVAWASFVVYQTRATDLHPGLADCLWERAREAYQQHDYASAQRYLDQLQSHLCELRQGVGVGP